MYSEVRMRINSADGYYFLMKKNVYFKPNVTHIGQVRFTHGKRDKTPGNEEKLRFVGKIFRQLFELLY